MKPELLSGDNQYQCEPCQKKCDAEKGIKIEKVPQIISVILNRFAFDYVKFQRIKLTDKVKFPFILNMNDFLAYLIAHFKPFFTPF